MTLAIWNLDVRNIEDEDGRIVDVLTERKLFCNGGHKGTITTYKISPTVTSYDENSKPAPHKSLRDAEAYLLCRYAG